MEKFKKEVEQVCSKVAGISGMSEERTRRDSNMVSFNMAQWNHVERHFLNRFPQQFPFLLVLVLLNAHCSLAGRYQICRRTPNDATPLDSCQILAL